MNYAAVHRWSEYARHLPGRTDKEIKNFWNTLTKNPPILLRFDPMTYRKLTQGRTAKDEIKNLKSIVDGQGLLSLPLIHFESQGATSIQSVDVTSESSMDYTNEFTNYKIFKNRETLIQCIHEVGKKNGFVIVIKRSDSGNGGQKARITFCCERGGQYRNIEKNKENRKEKQDPDTKKCGCPFTLKGNKLDDDDKWMLKVICGVHNHPTTKPLGGRSYEGRFSKKEASLVGYLLKSNVSPKDILAKLRSRDVNNVSTIKQIYNARYRQKLKGMAESSSNNTLTSNTFVSLFPDGLQSYIDNVKDVAADGNCGFRALADLMGFGENQWLRVRKDLLEELNSNSEEYSRLYGSGERVKELIDVLSYFKNCPGPDRWMTMPDMGHLIASAYNVVLFFISLQQCLTFLPLRSVPIPTDSRKNIAIGFVNNNHFVQVFLLPDHPVPPIATNWYKFHHTCASGWDTMYIPRIQHFKKVIGKDVATNEVIDIDSDSFNDELVQFTHQEDLLFLAYCPLKMICYIFLRVFLNDQGLGFPEEFTADNLISDYSLEYFVSFRISFRFLLELVIQMISLVETDINFDLSVIKKMQDDCFFTYDDFCSVIKKDGFCSFHEKPAYLVDMVYSWRLIFWTVGMLLSYSEKTIVDYIADGSIIKQEITTRLIRVGQGFLQGMRLGKREETDDFVLSDIETLPNVDAATPDGCLLENSECSYGIDNFQWEEFPLFQQGTD